MKKELSDAKMSVIHRNCYLVVDLCITSQCSYNMAQYCKQREMYNNNNKSKKDMFYFFTSF